MQVKEKGINFGAIPNKLRKEYQNKWLMDVHYQQLSLGNLPLL